MSYMSIKQMIVSFILCSVVALANNAGHTKQVNTNNTTSLKECKSEQDKMQGCVEKSHDTFLGDTYLIETPYKNGKEDGIGKWYYVNGNIFYEIPYKNGEIDGIVKEYYENKNLAKEIPYKSGKKDGIVKIYHENGNLWVKLTTKDDKYNGKVRYYLDDKQPLATITYENGKAMEGKCANNKKFDNNINMLVSNNNNYIQTTYILGEYCNVVNTNKSSNLKKCKYKQDTMQGCVEKKYYENGNLQYEAPYKNDKVNGIARAYYENGNLWGEMPVINNNANGETKLYLDNKQLLATIIYKDDKAIKGKCANNKNLDNNILDSINNNKAALENITKVLKEYCK